MFFRLNTLTYLIKGKSMAIYSMKNNVVYLLTKEIGDFLDYCENNNPIEKHELYLRDSQYIDKLLKTLESLDLGGISSNKTHIEKFQFNTTEMLYELVQVPPVYNKVIFNYSNRCNLNCDFCKKSSFKNWQGCVSCVSNKEDKSEIPDNEVLNIVNEIMSLNINELVIKGGNPLTNFNLIKDIAHSVAKKNQTKLKIISNGLGIEYNQLVELLSINDKIELKIVLFGLGEFVDKYSFNERYQRIIKQQTELMDKLLKDGLNFTTTFQILEENKAYAAETVNRIREKYPKALSISELSDIESGEELTIIKNNKFIPRYSSPKEYFWNKSHNRCAYGTFAINTNKELTVCSEIEYVLGNIGSDGQDILKALSNPQLYDYWKISKDKILNCQECSLRYFCLDCFNFEKSSQRKTFCNIVSDDLAVDYSKITDKEFIKQINI